MGEGRFNNLEFEDEEAREAGQPKRFVAEERDAEYFIGVARRRVLAGDFENALRSFSAALGEDQRALDAWVGQLQMLLEMGELPEARMWADKALERFPDHPQLLAAKAVALCRMGSRREARSLCDAALKKSGEDPIVWICRGEIILEESEAPARRCFDRAMALAPNDVFVRLQIGVRYLDRGMIGPAMLILEQACKDAPKAAWGHFLLGCAQREKGLRDKACRSLETANLLEPQLEKYRLAAIDVARSREGFLTGFWKRMTKR